MQHNKKLLATLLLSVISIALCAVAFAGCHCHNKHGYERVEATCTEDGYVKIWCDECNYVHEEDCETLPAQGHRFYGEDYCTVCGEPDLSNPAFGSEEDGLKLKLSEDGVLSWNRLGSVSKYELSITYSGATEATVYMLDKRTASVKLDDLVKENFYDETKFPAGKCSVKFTPYTVHKENIGGETIEQEYPVTEFADEFKIVKLNTKFSVVRMTYSDDNLTLKGFYADVKEDDGGNPYYLYELLLKNNKPTQFYIKNCVQLKSGCAAQYYSTAQDRSSNTNALSDMDLRFQYVSAGGNNVFYARVTLAEGGYKDYDLRIYGLQTLKFQRLLVTSSTGADGYRTDTYAQIGAEQSYTEGDIVPNEALFAGTSCSDARDGNYNLIEKGEDKGDLILTAPAYGDTVKIYFGDKVRSDCQDYKRYYEYYNLTETEYGWQLYADETKKEMPEGSGANILPYQICGKKILSYTFNNVNATALWVPQEVKQLNITITNCAKLTSVRIYSPQTYIGEAAFAGAPDNLVIECKFSVTESTNFDRNWNAKQKNNVYAGRFTVKYTDT